MKKITTYTLLLAATLLVGCKGEEPQNNEQVQTFEISFDVNGGYDVQVDTQMGDDFVEKTPLRLPGDPGTTTNTWVNPRYLYMIVTSKSGSQNYIATARVENAEWVRSGNTDSYDHAPSYKVTLASGQMTDNTYYVYAIASPYALTFNQSLLFPLYSSLGASGLVVAATSITNDDILNLTYTIPTVIGKTESEVQRTIFSTVGANAKRSQTSFQPRCVLYHTASLLDINWSNDVGFAGANLTLGNFYSTGLYCFKPGATGSGSTYTERVTLTPETQHYGRYATYVAKPSTLTATDGVVSKTASVNLGPDTNLNTWQRILWKVN